MYDYHTHTDFSDDSKTPIEASIKAAIRIGLQELAITDHYDPGYPNLDIPFMLDLTRYFQTLDEFKGKYADQIKLIRGIELGLQLSELEECRRVASTYNFDFIIGSFHAAQGLELYGSSFYVNRSSIQSYRAFYEEMHACLKQFKEYSVIGHFNIVDRYTDEIAPFKSYSDIVESILRMVIEDGKGLEINTSSFRYGMGNLTTPSSEILTLYRSLGGQIITIGSDAHTPKDLAFGIENALEMVKHFGFQHLTTFEKRVPNFIKLA